MRSLYSTIRSLSDSIALSSGPNPACSSGLSSCTFAGFMFRGLQPRNRSPYDFRHQSTNPRKRFDAKSLEELAASFGTQGILAPLLVPELEESKHEVVAGARRLLIMRRRVALSHACAIVPARASNVRKLGLFR